MNARRHRILLRIVYFLFVGCICAVFGERPDSWRGERVHDNSEKSAGSSSRSISNLVKPLDEVWRIVFKNAKGKDVVLDCEVARSEKEKEHGLMFRKNLAKNRGMIFVYSKPSEMNFWMQNTVLPLSIAFIHENLFVSSLHDMKPMSLDIVGSEVPVLYAIEANQGWFKSNAILSGNRLVIFKNPNEYQVKKQNKYRKSVPQP